MNTKSLNRRLKGWVGWLALIFVVAAALTIGIASTTGPQTPEERIDAISKRVACPVCDGESVFESQNSASIAIRNQVGDLVAENDLGDDQIVAFIETRYGAQVLLVPRASGFDGLAVAFRRWRVQADGTLDPTDDDRALVEAALRDQRGSADTK